MTGPLDDNRLVSLVACLIGFLWQVPPPGHLVIGVPVSSVWRYDATIRKCAIIVIPGGVDAAARRSEQDKFDAGGVSSQVACLRAAYGGDHTLAPYAVIEYDGSRTSPPHC